MKIYHYFFLFKMCFAICFPTIVNAQIEKVMVETYYISDANDATDTTGGFIEEGTKTYRVFIDLLPGTKLRKIYGDNNHPLIFSSTSPFYNNKADGQSFAKDFSKSRLQENTVALDTWLTLGQVTRVAAKTYFGVSKQSDSDSSVIGGVNNDGGSAAIPGGLLTNSNFDLGIPLTISDGMDTMSTLPTSWFDYGIVDFATGIDTTIFGSVVSGSYFISNNAGLQNSGVSGKLADSNQVLVAQLSTKGDVSFEINLEVEETVSSITRIVKYVANGSTLLSDERLSPWLKYPPVCGCTDPHFLEYSPSYSCSNSDSCSTLIVYGCMDTMACNFDPDANFNLPALCCYPGYCNDRDINIVCPDIAIEKQAKNNFVMFPNPTKDKISIRGNCDDNSPVSYTIIDS